MFSIDDLNKQPDFKLPDNYFDKMQDEVLIKISRYERTLKQRKIFYSVGSIAASLLIVFSIVYFFPKENSSDFAALVIKNEKMQSIEDSYSITDMEYDIESPQKNKVSVNQMITEIELHNLDYDIVELYEESMYDIALLDLYY